MFNFLRNAAKKSYFFNGSDIKRGGVKVLPLRKKSLFWVPTALELEGGGERP